MIGLAMRSSPMRKLRRERSVCAPQKSIGWHLDGTERVAFGARLGQIWPSCGRLSWSEYAQRPRPAPIAQRQLHSFNLTVKRNEQPLTARADFGRIAFEDAQIALLIEKAKHAAAGKHKHRCTTLHFGNVETQLPPIEPVTSAEGRHRKTILVVSNKHARATAQFSQILNTDLEPEQRQVPNYARQGQSDGRPF
jgi:hypothetical protein